MTGKKLKDAGVKVPGNTKLNNPGKQLAEELYRSRRANRHDREKTAAIAARSVVRVEDLVDVLRKDYAKRGRKTWDHLEARLKRNVIPFWGRKDANAITTEDIDSYISRRSEGGATAGTLNREFSALRRMLNLGYRETPPRVARVPYFERLKEALPRQGFVTEDVYLTLRGNASEFWLKSMLATAYDFGFRKSELLGLRVSQIDLTDRTIKLNRGETKNDAARTVVMTADVLALITLCVQGKKPQDWVFSRGDNSEIKDFRKSWENLCAAAGVPDLLFHDLRRSAVRNMIRRGIPEVVAMRISGHKTRSVFDRYNIVDQADLASAAVKIQAGRDTDKKLTQRLRCQLSQRPARYSKYHYFLNLQCVARVAKLADARDLKSRVLNRTYRFNSGPGHHLSSAFSISSGDFMKRNS